MKKEAEKSKLSDMFINKPEKPGQKIGFLFNSLLSSTEKPKLPKSGLTSYPYLWIKR